MTKKALNQLPAETIKLLSSSQIITSVGTAVKELIENSLDADSRIIQVKLENYGFDVLEVKDDGHGISYDNVQKMFLSGYTSKITCFNDLVKLETYGFRGEALSALAKLSNISVTTKTASDTLAMTYVINKEGIPESSKPSHIIKGTIVTVKNLFGNLPVRKQYLSNKKKVVEELKKVEYIVQSLSAIHPELRIVLFHNKCPIWQKNAVKGLMQSFMQIVGLKVVSKMAHLNELSNNILVDLIIPKKSLMDNIDVIFSNSSQSTYLYVNRRPVSLSKISKIVMEHIFLHYSDKNSKYKYAICLISIEVPPQEIDVNLEPNKTKIFLKNETDVIDLIDQILSSHYGQKIDKPEPVKEEFISEVGSEDEELFSENQLHKRPRLESDDDMTVRSTSDKENSDKDNGWRLDIITTNDLPSSEYPSLTLCSQINKDNCILATDKEKGELQKLLDENNQKMVTSLNLENEFKSVERKEIQNHDRMTNSNSGKVVKEVPVSVEKPILPSWPVRSMYVKPVIIDKERPKTTSIDNKELLQRVQDCDLLDENIFDKISAVEWSKGTVEVDGVKLQSGVVLNKPNLLNEECSEVRDEDLQQFDLSMRSISSQMGKKELAAFTKFARIMRPKLLNEFPGMVFTKVAEFLAERWRVLPPEEKRYYEKLSKVVDLKREIHREQKTLEDCKVTKSSPKKKKKLTEKKPERFELQITASLEAVIQKRNVTWTETSAIKLVGKLEPRGDWLYKKGNEIGHLRHCGLQEVILSQRMLSNHVVPRHPTPAAILINDDILGKEEWDTLIGLEMEFDQLTCSFNVVSPVITKNGFRIEMEKNGNIMKLGWVKEVAAVIPFYGLAELKETLRLYNTYGEFADLGCLRPNAVTDYITKEAIRIVRQSPCPPDIRELQEWIDTWQMCLNHLPPQCLHNRDIFVPIYHK